jgi:hypothetical protein
MSEMNHEVSALLASMRSVKVKVLKPHCWLVKLPAIPWQRSRAEKERTALLSDLQGMYRTAALGTPHPEQDKWSWRVGVDNAPALIDELEGYLGHWLLLLFKHEPAESLGLPERMGGSKYDDLKKLLDSTGADLEVASFPDDIEWMIVERI